MQVKEERKVPSAETPDEESAEDCSGEEAAAVMETLPSSPSSCMIIRLTIVQTVPRLTRCQEAKGHRKVSHNRLAYLPTSYVSTIQILQTNCSQEYRYPHNSTTLRWVPVKGPGARAAFWPPEIPKQHRKAVSPLHRPWYGFFLISVETMPYEGKFICWCQKGKHNWHSQLICSPPMDNS